MAVWIRDALLWAGLAVLLAGPVTGLQLERGLRGLSLAPEWLNVVWLGLGVFLFRLLQQALRPALGRLPRVRVPEPVQGFLRHPVTLAGLLVALAVLPFVADRQVTSVAVVALIYVMLGLGLNIVVGLAGLLDLGYVAFYAVGAYAYALLAQHFGISFWMALPICAALAALFGFLLGFPVLRLRGDYLAIVTLGFGEIIHLVLKNWDELTGGPDGIRQIPPPTLFGLEFTSRPSEGATAFHEYFGLPFSGEYRLIYSYLIGLALAGLSVWLVHRLRYMPVGRAWEALREDEIAARAMGLNPTTIKLSAFTLGAAFAGVAGCFFASFQRSITPESFTFIESAIVLAIVILGGMGSLAGVILAAVFMTVLPELGREFAEYRMLAFGAAMVLMMIWHPQGLLPSRRPRLELPQ